MKFSLIDLSTIGLAFSAGPLCRIFEIIISNIDARTVVALITRINRASNKLAFTNCIAYAA